MIRFLINWHLKIITLSDEPEYKNLLQIEQNQWNGYE